MTDETRSSELDERALRIVDVAVGLAESDGYEAVRLRDVAANAGVALGTVYKRFSSKEDILAAALELQVEAMGAQLRLAPLPGETGQERLVIFFELATGVLAQRPRLAAAMLRTVASGVPELSERVLRYQNHITELLVGVHRGSWEEGAPEPEERMLAELLQNIWFGALVGWTGGRHDAEDVAREMRTAVAWLLRGMGAR